MTKKTAKQRTLEARGFKTRSYSGRGMYGKECLGVVVESVLRSGLSPSMLRGSCSDGMGLSVIVYWPSVPFVGDVVA